MTPYIVNKIIGLGVPAAAIFLSYLYIGENNQHFWWLILVLAQSCGFAHYILGFKYQYSSLRRKKSRKMMGWFFGLVLASILVVGGFAVFGQLGWVVVLMVPYFLFHGALNEHTIIQRQLGSAPDPSRFMPLFFLILGFFLLSYHHPSFFNSFNWMQVDYNVFVNHVKFMIGIGEYPEFKAFAYLSFAIFMLLVPGRLFFERQWRNGAAVLIISSAIIMVVLSLPALNYVVLLALALMYHFTSWSFFFYQEFKKNRPELVQRYIWEHVVVGVPIVLIALATLMAPHWFGGLHSNLFNGAFYLALTAAHISAAFLNDEWFRKLIRVER